MGCEGTDGGGGWGDRGKGAGVERRPPTYLLCPPSDLLRRHWTGRAPIDFHKLPPNYHTEEKEQRRVGNATVYSHREINKMSRGSQAESSEEGAGGGAEAEPVLGRHVLPIPRPGLAFLIIHLQRRTRPGKASDTSRPDGASLSDRKHRLLAIRDGLMEAPHPLKKAPPITRQKERDLGRRWRRCWRICVESPAP
uniref:Uncharacterized protein n=1 Tax=Chelonoidis abingdonii TaxID=106734 RepID=A0A8C0G258_CHEAB